MIRLLRVVYESEPWLNLTFLLYYTLTTTYHESLVWNEHNQIIIAPEGNQHMDTARALVPWVLFLLMAIVAAFFWHQSDTRGRHIASLSATIAQMETHIEELTGSVDSLEDQVERAMATIAALREAAPPASDVDEDADDADGASAGMDDLLGMSMGDMLDTLLSDDASGDTPDNAAFEMMTELFRGPQGEQMLDMSTQMTMNMQYADFFNMLPPESVDAVREIMGDYLIHTARLSMGLLDGGADREGAATAMEATRETMLTELRGVIGDDGVAMYEQYEQELPGRMLDQALEMQMGMFARGLSAETQELVRHTLVEELLAAQPENMMAFPTPDAMRDGVLTQQEAYERALERLAPHLMEEEYETVHGFVQQQQQMMDMFGSMMGGRADAQ